MDARLVAQVTYWFAPHLGVLLQTEAGAVRYFLVPEAATEGLVTVGVAFQDGDGLSPRVKFFAH